MKKFLAAFLFALLLASFAAAAWAESGVVHAGVLTYLGTTEEEFQRGLDDLRKALNPLIPADGDLSRTGDEWSGFDELQGFLGSLVTQRRVVHFFDSLMTMQMGLRAKKIDEMALPECVGLFLVDRDPHYEIQFSLHMMPSTISFGFRKGDTALQKDFNAAIAAMKKDGTLAKLERKFITDLGPKEPERVTFQSFKDAPTIKVAVTGDMPPIDLIAADGRPTGYNTAVLSEMGRRMKKNIRLISVDAGGRSAALASQRADVVFWYRSTEGIKMPAKVKGNPMKNAMRDALEGVILSNPYYEWDTDLIIGRAQQ
ncbi:MAG: transporter substrate-binding domain-containing protein [Synergistaceae bacterium]|nr:transporter substrate-binding domain-containing protein [Synergistaceae bacterium]